MDLLLVEFILERVGCLDKSDEVLHYQEPLKDLVLYLVELVHRPDVKLIVLFAMLNEINRWVENLPQ